MLKNVYTAKPRKTAKAQKENNKNMLEANIRISEHQNEFIREPEYQTINLKSDTLNSEISIWHSGNLVICV